MAVDTRTMELGGADDSELRLLVIEGDQVKTHPLPSRGTLVIGRADECSVRIDHPSLSRRHVAIDIDGSVWIRELGSTNGTRLGGRRLPPNERIAWPVGEMIEIGPLTAVVQGAAAAGPTLAETEPNRGSMDRVRRLCDRVALGTLSVLILGETGVGKEVLAERLHHQSPRRDKPFLRLNCAALTESLFESELFGHERGAFTGALQSKPGLLETADSGTAFLDEVGELSPTMQVKLLRVIERREVLRVGGLKPQSVDVRWVSATHRDLSREVKSGHFRADLYFRLNGISLTVPPLRERRDEIEALARGFAAEACSAGGVPPVELAGETIRRLVSYDWPGNIRELRNVMERAVLLTSRGVIRPSHLALGDAEIEASSLGGHTPPPKTPAPTPPGGIAINPSSEGDSPPSSRDTIAAPTAAERERIQNALWKNGGNQSLTAKELGISRRTLLKKLDRYNIPRPQKGRGV